MPKVKVKMNYIPCVPLATHLHTDDSLREDRQVGQAWFTFGKSMLTIPNHPVLSCVLRNDSQD